MPKLAENKMLSILWYKIMRAQTQRIVEMVNLIERDKSGSVPIKAGTIARPNSNKVSIRPTQRKTTRNIKALATLAWVGTQLFKALRSMKRALIAGCRQIDWSHCSMMAAPNPHAALLFGRMPHHHYDCRR